MKWIGYNIVALALVALSAYMIYDHRSGYGWVIFAALVCTVVPDNDKPSNK
jgi:hypothetical protein